MKLLQKLQDFRTNHKIVTAIIDGAATFAAANTGATALDALVGTKVVAEAQADFFDGCRGPSLLQLDQRLTFGESKPTYIVLPKIFVDTDGDGNGLLGVTPISYIPDHKPAVGAGIGGFFDLGNVSLLGVLPVVYSTEGKIVNINPTLYATIMAGDFLIDPRIDYLASIAKDGTSYQLSFGVTLGYKIDNVILGIDVASNFDPSSISTDQLRDNLRYQGIIRIDFDEDHKSWIQAYLGEDAIGIGFRTNFRFK